MQSIVKRSVAGALAGAALLTAAPGIAAAHHATPARGLSANTRQYVPPPDPDGVRQVAQLVRRHQLRDAALVAREITTPQAVWFTKGTPREVGGPSAPRCGRRSASTRCRRSSPITSPYRDCGQYSAGGALNTAEYGEWIDGFAKGLGRGSADVILEPDGLGIIPFYTPLYGAMEWCQPKGDAGKPARGPTRSIGSPRSTQPSTGSSASPARRSTSTAPTAAWLDAGDPATACSRPVCSERRASSSMSPTTGRPSDSAQFGTWVSDCIAFATNGDGRRLAPRPYDYCAGQYNAAGQPTTARTRSRRRTRGTRPTSAPRSRPRIS